MIIFKARHRMRRALLLIGAQCQNYTTGIGSCWADRQPDAQYTADRWCDGCIAAWGLGIPRRTPGLKSLCPCGADYCQGCRRGGWLRHHGARA